MTLSKYSKIQMSGCDLQSSEPEVVQERQTIPRFDYDLWRSGIDRALEKEVVTRTGIVLEEIIRLITSNKYRRGPRRFFELNRRSYAEKMNAAVQDDRPIEFVLPSFPVKCFNPLKVRRRNPDLAEIGCLSKLYTLCRSVEQIYEPGARVILLTDGLVYAPIFQEPMEHAQEYREEVRQLVRELRMDHWITVVEMTGLIANRQDEFAETQRTVKREMARYWKEYPHHPDLIGLIENTMTNINLMMYPESELIDVFVNGANQRLKEEIRSRSVASAFEYAVFNQTIKEMDLIGGAFPRSLRVTCHPKEGQLGLHLVHPNSFNFPWNGVGVLRVDGTVRVEFEYEVRRNPTYVPVYLECDDYPFYFQHP